MTLLLTISGLHKKFGEHTLLEIDELTIKPATAYVLTGPNGSGKSTLLRILGGLETADIAQASFHGKPVQFSPYAQALRNSVVYVHQHPVILSSSVASNIGYGLCMRGIPASIIDAQVEEAMEWAGVSHLREHKPATLSGGEKQRVALARAKVLKPELLLLDEPTSSLDGPAKEQVLTLIPDLINAGSSIVMASHDQGLVRLPELYRMDLRNGRMTFDKYSAVSSTILEEKPFTDTSEDPMQLSARNQLEGVIRAINEGPINSEVTIEIAPGVMIYSQISTNSVKRLQLEVGKPATAIIKTDSVMVGIN